MNRFRSDAPLILASASPRRRELLQMAGISFDIIPSCAEELPPGSLSVDRTVIENASRKASEVSKRFPNRTVLGADTLVTLNGTVLGKPHDREDAKRMLRLLSGNTHKVLTGICITDGKKTETALSVTDVTFRTLPEALIEQYVAIGECDDKAGAYGIQGRGCIFVDHLDGDYFGVMGLPICKVYRILSDF